MKTMKKIPASLCAFALLCAIFTNTSCVRKKNSGENAVKKIVFIPKITGNAFFETANDGARRCAEKAGFIVEYKGSPDAAVSNQVSIIRDAIKDGVDGISISSLDSTVLDNVLKEAMRKGIAVTTWDSDVSPDARQVMVSQGTPDMLGKMLIDMASQSLRDRGVDPETKPVRYVWHYSRPTVTDQNSWKNSGEAYIAEKYPLWVNAHPENFYSNQDYELALETGASVLQNIPSLDLVICPDSTALPAQLEAAKSLGFDKERVTITGFATPNSVKPYAREGIIQRWGLWDSAVQGAMSVYLTYYIALGNKIEVGRDVVIPDIGKVKIFPNDVLNPVAWVSENSGVVLLPYRLEFTTSNMDEYNF